MDLAELLRDAPTSAPAPPEDAADARLREQDRLRAEMEENFHLYTEVKKLPSADRDALFSLLYDAQNGNAEALRAIHTLIYEEVPVSMEEFLLGRQYLNLRGRINPEKIDILVAFDQPHVRHAWMAVGAGGGKGFSVSVAMARQVYMLECLRRPDLFYLLGPGSNISVINLSVGKEQAKSVVFNEFLARVENCAWLKPRCKPTTRSAEFSKGVVAFSGGSSATSYYGYHTIFGSIDEAAYMVEGDRDVAEELIEALRKSMATRFPNAYKLMVISTLRAEHDFVNLNVQRIKNSGVKVL